jgi:ABC-type bacteriocin/lantibiotic exporters, contain an N-terminal double-glycine peptidase domain
MHLLFFNAWSLIAARYFDLASSTIALVTIILYRLFQKIKIFQQCFQSFNKAVPGHFSIKNEISKKQDLYDYWGKKKFNGIKNYIEFKDASFSIDKRKILSKLNFKFEKNKINVIIGKSGSGKTTLVDLVTGLTELEKGHLKIDEYDLKDFSKSSYLNSIGYVDQNPYLFNDTIINNIKWGSKNNISKNKIYKLTKELKIHNLISNLPKGYNSNVGDFGNSLSGGERQRIVIVRTLINDPKILILDEATSQLDSKSQKIVMSFLKKIKKTTTIIMVTHRKETLEIADKVLEIN